MSRILILALVIGMLGACKSKPKNVNDEDRVLTFADFRDFFPEAALPYRLNADSLQRLPDSLALKAKVAKQFLPDTLAAGIFKAADKPKFFPRGYMRINDLQFLVVEGATKAASAAWIMVYDKRDTFLTRHLIARTGGRTTVGTVLDTRYNFRITTETKRGPGQVSTREDVYSAGIDGQLSLILTNSNEPTNPTLYNPIDTLPRKHKFSGNFGTGEMNLVAIRDGETPQEFLFYIHFSRDKGACTGELDGVGRFTGSNTGQFRDKGSSCILEFKFSSNKVTISETNCGAYRGITCMFEGSYPRKKK